MKRGAGVLMPIFSLPSRYGIGTLGKSAREFIDFLSEAGFTYWQILPLGPTGYSNSPYQLSSVYAGNPYLIDLEDLQEQGYLTKKDLQTYSETKEITKIDYGKLYNERFKILKKACSRVTQIDKDTYFDFIKEEGFWLSNYALFMAIKEQQKGKSWVDWPQEYQDFETAKNSDISAQLHDSISMQLRMQYFFYQQMLSLKEYANKKGILLIGDLPFYSGQDSLDTWVSKKYFLMNEDNTLSYVAGMPGQRWGNPLFDWDALKQDGYAWWTQRLAHQYRFYDVVRIDHFRGYFDYYKIPAEDQEGQQGIYCKSVGLEPFEAFKKQYGDKPMIVEDLGELTEDFKQFVKESGYPGMKILEFAFDPNDPDGYYMPYHYSDRNAVVYTGTHDNHTVKGWIKEEPLRAKRAAAYLGISVEKLSEGMIKCAYGSPCDVAIVQAQDLLQADDSARINTPGADKDNWIWRCKPAVFTSSLAEKISEELKLYGRFNWDAMK